MEYSPGNAIPYISRVDAGTVEAVRQLGVDVVSSGDLVQRFEAVWSDEALATHRAASERLYRIKDRAFELVRDVARDRAGADRVRRAAGNGGLVRGRRARHATPPRSSRRRRTPATRTTDQIAPRPRQIRRERGRPARSLGQAGRRPARCLLTSPGWGLQVRPCRTDMRRAFAAARDGRDAAIALVTERVAAGTRAPRVRSGSRVPRRDRAARASGRSSSTAPGTASAPKCMATASTWTTTRRTTSAG